MASNTENLDLLMKNPSTDGADTFNVQTMLNENWQKIDNNAGTVAQTLANILKPTTPPIIGLPSSATPNDMFNVLAHAGDLHVWRKTVVTKDPIPAGYTLGASAAKTLAKSSENSGNSYATFYISSSISVDDAGNVTMNSPATVDIWQGIDAYDSGERAIFGKFIKFYSVSNPNAGITSDLETGIYFIPNSAEFTRYRNGNHSGYTNISACQKVDAYPLTPAGTTVTYPVSTNRNAYQEGNDAKPAGYTLGDVVTGSFSLGTTAGTQTYTYESATSLDVGDDGTVSLQNPSSGSFGTMGGLSPGDNLSTIQTFILGKFVRCTGINTSYVSGAPDTKYPFNVVPSDIVYIPSNANVTKTSNVIYIDRYQPVTGYAAIPANTTIENLGCLGDKARVQVVSYVGTGTYGSSNPCNLTFDFPPKVVMFLRGYKKGSTQFGHLTASHSDDNKVVTPESLTTTYTRYNGFGGPFGSYAKKSEDGKTIFWYNEQPSTQGNDTGYTYYFLAIG